MRTPSSIPRRPLLLALTALLAACSDGGTGSGEPPDTRAPTLSVASPTAGFATAASTVAVSGTATDDRGVTRVSYRLNGGGEVEVPVTAGTSVSFAFTAALAEGANTLTVVAVDGAGNRAEAAVGGDRDATAPALALTSPAAGAATIAATATVAGTATDARGVTRVTVRVNGGAETDVPITPGPSVAFSAEVPVAVGAAALQVRAYDALGNVATGDASVTRRAAGEARVTLRDAAGAPVTDAQVTAAVAAASRGAAPAVVYGPGGLYAFEHLGNGTYRVLLATGLIFDLQVARPGSLTLVYRGVAVTAAAPTQLEGIDLVNAGGGTGSAALRVRDAFTGAALAGVGLTLRAGVNTATGPAVASGTTDAAGGLTMAALPAGYYTAEMSRAGYSRGFFTVVVHAGRAGTFTGSITPVVPTGQLRIILDWGATPSDLDSHFTGPNDAGTGRFHVYYAAKQYVSGSFLVAALDVDDVSSYGPETVTLYRQRSGRYRYSVHDFTNAGATASTALSRSSARVRVYSGASLVATYFVPAGTGTLWTVFELDGATLIPVNTLTNHADDGTIPSIRPDDGAAVALPAKRP